MPVLRKLRFCENGEARTGAVQHSKYLPLYFVKLVVQLGQKKYLAIVKEEVGLVVMEEEEEERLVEK